MADVGFVYGSDFQRAVLKLMLTEHSFSSKCAAYLNEDYFTAELKWFFRKSKEWVVKYNRIPTKEFFNVEISKHNEDAPKYEAHFNEILASSLSNKDFIKSEMTSFIRANIFVGSYREAALLYNNGTRDQAYQFVNQKMVELTQATFEDDRIAHFGDYESVVDQASQQVKDAVPTGIALFDETLLGGLLPQTWTTFIGSSNSGKSMVGPNLAFYAAEAGKKTFVTVHEDEELPTKLRFLSRFSGIPYNRLVTPRAFWDQDQKDRVAEADKRLSKFVSIKFMYGLECTIEKVAEAARMQYQEEPFHLFFNDYGQCLKTKAFKSMDDSYNRNEYVYSELKQICLELKCAGAGGAQTNRTGHAINRSGASLLRMNDVGDSWGICKKSSNVITLNRSVEDIVANRITFLLDKGRNGRVPIAVQCISDYSRCTTHLPHSDLEPTQREVPMDERKG